MPQFHSSHANEDGYDPEMTRCEVLYDERAEAYICGICLDDFSVSLLHDTYGGDLLPVPTFRSRKTMKHLHGALCGLCGLPASRAFDE